MRNLYRRGLVSALSGNASIRVPGTNCVWITPSGIFKGGLTVDDLVKIDLEGNVVEGFRKPSSEWRFHVAIYKARPDINAVIHAHNPVTVAFSLSGLRLDESLLSEVMYFIKRIEYIPLVEPGTETLAKLVADKVSRGSNAIILERHGVIGIGKDIYEAEMIVESLEDLANVQLLSGLIRFLFSLS
uniref:Class II aldolase/adducin family protein n=1 Tax=Ignisphaera aggregans TaxID=334771 RepID=A0A7C4BC82_9CREN